MSYKKNLPPRLVAKSSVIEALRKASKEGGSPETERVIQNLLANPSDTVILSGLSMHAGNSPHKPKKGPS
jgi:hypothetical protein